MGSSKQMSVKVLSTITRSVSWISVPHWSMQNTAQRCSSACQDKVRTAKSCLKVLPPYFNDICNLFLNSFSFLIHNHNLNWVIHHCAISFDEHTNEPHLLCFWSTLSLSTSTGSADLQRANYQVKNTYLMSPSSFHEFVVNTHLTELLFPNMVLELQRPCSTRNRSSIPAAQCSIKTTGGGQMNINAIRNKKHCKGN